MNERNPHILKTWLAKAAADADSFIGEQRPYLTWVYGYRHLGRWEVTSADGHRMHIAHHLPALLRADAEKEGDVYVIELPNSVTDDSGISKWAMKIAENVHVVSRPVIENRHSVCYVNPAHLMREAKWINAYEDAPIVLSAARSNLEVWGRAHFGVLPAARVPEPFKIMVNPQYLMDALWIHYYEPAVALYVDPTNTVLGVGDPNGNFAVIMAMAGTTPSHPHTMRHTIEMSEDMAVTYEV